MKTSFFISISITLFVLTACTKEALVTPTSNEPSFTQQYTNLISPSDPDHRMYEEGGTASSSISAVAVDVDLPTVSVTATELIVEFTANYDFSVVIPDTTQHLNFTDAQAAISNLALDISSYLGESGRFSVHFDLNGQSLNGLAISPTQVIGVEDILVY
ncbi:MAG: hypothetical protein AAF847_11800 [Bacteroidota bacterium]